MAGTTGLVWVKRGGEWVTEPEPAPQPKRQGHRRLALGVCDSTSVDDAITQLAAACDRWRDSDRTEDRQGARDAAVFRARQLLEVIGVQP